jgi:hypothetical protein
MNISPRIRKEVLKRDNNKCQKCGEIANIIHHIMPRSLGGSDLLNNLVTLCKQCHMIAHDLPTYKIIEDGVLTCDVRKVGSGAHIILPKKMIGKKVIITLAGLVIVIVLTFAITLSFVTPSSFVLASNETGFNIGYNTGVHQGQVDGKSNTFHIGTLCVGQTVAWCSGYTLGYLDGFLPTSTLNQSKHTVQEITPSRIIN